MVGVKINIFVAPHLCTFKLKCGKNSKWDLEVLKTALKEKNSGSPPAPLWKWNGSHWIFRGNSGCLTSEGSGLGWGSGSGLGLQMKGSGLESRSGLGSQLGSRSGLGSGSGSGLQMKGLGLVQYDLMGSTGQTDCLSSIFPKNVLPSFLFFASASFSWPWRCSRCGSRWSWQLGKHPGSATIAKHWTQSGGQSQQSSKELEFRRTQ